MIGVQTFLNLPRRQDRQHHPACPQEAKEGHFVHPKNAGQGKVIHQIFHPQPVPAFGIQPVNKPNSQYRQQPGRVRTTLIPF